MKGLAMGLLVALVAADGRAGEVSLAGGYTPSVGLVAAGLSFRPVPVLSAGVEAQGFIERGLGAMVFATGKAAPLRNHRVSPYLHGGLGRYFTERYDSRTWGAGVSPQKRRVAEAWWFTGTGIDVKAGRRMTVFGEVRYFVGPVDDSGDIRFGVRWSLSRST